MTDLYAVDPGGTIGVCRSWKPGEYELRVFTEPLQVAQWIWSNTHPQSKVHVVLEDFSGAGRLSGDAKRTMNQVGAIELWCQWVGIPCTVWPEQKRLSGLTEAEIIGKKLLPDLPAAIRKHAIDATAHAVVWRRHNSGE
jgi:hypothetical protein